MDIICAKCGKHLSSIEMAREHNCHCKRVFNNQKLNRINSSSSKLTQEELNNLRKAFSQKDTDNCSNNIPKDSSKIHTNTTYKHSNSYIKTKLPRKSYSTDRIRIPQWLLALSFIFIFIIIGLTINLLIDKIFPIFLLLGFALIFSFDKWLFFYLKSSKFFGIFFRLIINISLLCLLIFLIWFIYGNIYKQNDMYILINIVILLFGIILFIWLSRIVIKNRWRKPSMKLTTFFLVIVLVFFHFCNITPFSDYSRNFFNYTQPGIENIFSSLKYGLNNLSAWLSGTSEESIEKRVQALYEVTNQERIKYGLKPFTTNLVLEQLAQQHAEDMYNRASVDHSGFNNRANIVLNSGFRTVAENCAGGGYEASSFIKMWMNSPGHRANILDPSLSQIGVGICGKYAVQIFGG